MKMKKARILEEISKVGEKMAYLYHNVGRDNEVLANEYFHSLVIVSNIFEKITGLDMFYIWLKMARKEE